MDRGVDRRWSVRVQVPAVASADEEALREAMAWCVHRGGRRGFGFSVPAAERTALLTRFGLVHRDALPVYAMPASVAAGLDATAMPGTDIGDPRDLAGLVAAYGGWMDDTALARGLLRAEDLPLLPAGSWCAASRAGRCDAPGLVRGRHGVSVGDRDRSPGPAAAATAAR